MSKKPSKRSRKLQNDAPAGASSLYSTIKLWYRTVCAPTLLLLAIALLLPTATAARADEDTAPTTPDVNQPERSGDAKTSAPAPQIPPALWAAEEARIKAIAKATQATIGIFGPEGKGGGSGVVISADGYALSNYHVVEGNGGFMKCSMPDGVLYDAVIVGIDPTGDVALVKLLGRTDFPVATIADSDQVRIGDWCFAIGNPFLLATNFQPSVSMGIISGKNRYQYPAGTLLEYADCLQTDAAINPGNSGGALFNANGDLIGINGRGSFEKRGRVNVGVGYAISINQINYFLDHLKSGRLVDHATLGATVESDDQGVVRVSEVLPTSDAFRRGLRYDDEIVSFAGRKISTVNQFKNVLGILPKGFTVPIVYRRDNQQYNDTVRLAGVHAAGQLAEMIEGESPLDPNQPEMPDDLPGPKDNSEDDLPNDSSNGETEEDKEAGHPFSHLYIKRTGFTNYYFNLQQRNRIWQQFEDVGGVWGKEPGRWRISGKARDSEAADEVSFQLLLGDDKSGIRIGDSSFVLDPGEDFSQQLFPPDSGGLLVALHMWRNMLIEGPKNFGDVYYFGGLPSQIAGEESVDVLIATRGVTETHFRFNRRTSLLQSAEMFPDLNTDPCRLVFRDYQRDGDLLVPREIQFVETGKEAKPGEANDIVKKSLVIERIEFLKHAAQKGSSKKSNSKEGNDE